MEEKKNVRLTRLEKEINSYLHQIKAELNANSTEKTGDFQNLINKFGKKKPKATPNVIDLIDMALLKANSNRDTMNADSEGTRNLKGRDSLDYSQIIKELELEAAKKDIDWDKNSLNSFKGEKTRKKSYKRQTQLEKTQKRENRVSLKRGFEVDKTKNDYLSQNSSSTSFSEYDNKMSFAKIRKQLSPKGIIKKGREERKQSSEKLRRLKNIPQKKLEDLLESDSYFNQTKEYFYEEPSINFDLSVSRIELSNIDKKVSTVKKCSNVFINNEKVLNENKVNHYMPFLNAKKYSL